MDASRILTPKFRESTNSLMAIPYPGTDFVRYRIFPIKDYVPTTGSYPICGKAKYYQAPGSKVRLYKTPSYKTDVLFVTEGEKKALRLHQEGYPAAGIPGVWNYRSGGQLFPELIVKELRYIPDNDVWTNEMATLALSAFKFECERHNVLFTVLQFKEASV
jgi:hypothetical protein